MVAKSATFWRFSSWDYRKNLTFFRCFFEGWDAKKTPLAQQMSWPSATNIIMIICSRFHQDGRWIQVMRPLGIQSWCMTIFTIVLVKNICKLINGKEIEQWKTQQSIVYTVPEGLIFIVQVFTALACPPQARNIKKQLEAPSPDARNSIFKSPNPKRNKTTKAPGSSAVFFLKHRVLNFGLKPNRLDPLYYQGGEKYANWNTVG